MKPTISTETQQEALAAAKATQKPGQTKEQTKLIAQGIEKGIAEYKKLLKAKARERDKARKQQLKAKARTVNDIDNLDDADEIIDSQSQFTRATWVAIALLVLSWAGFTAYYVMT
ncbi:MAG: DUF2956 domain-containing protein [Gammaproteobacteria bacterium]|nr:DUF2956 domain-containing protein [Gammaproteobacteria bacterium]MBU1477520.1 DUF2956 domain-containing protein [Gammaproteobacteria bacterium]MBU2002683.1 DUF2956 domain-containing protein [Gammaproteobacteria bacterium]MBU2131858.1 DUF2956 domain-containing protein [Gammaproteobacteria bacterium]MBU2186593.1 DUF2956 domain-containing protein [Gammaproteobacteria bacterium]